MEYFFDTYAIVEIIKLNSDFDRFKQLKITTSILNLGEFYNLLLRDQGMGAADEMFETCNFEFLDISPEIIIRAIRFRSDNKKKNLSLTDSVGYILSLKHNLKFLTGDRQFEKMPNVEFVK